MLSVCVVLTLFVWLVQNVSSDEVIRIRGGANEPYEDTAGNIWEAAQEPYDANGWGGYVGQLPNTTIGEGAKNVIGNDTEYDDEIFVAVSWQGHPGTVNIDVNTGNGTFAVIYLVGEHWSPNNRGYDIIIEDEIVAEEYVTPGRDEIDMLTFEDIQVTDEVMSFVFKGNPATGKGDLNPMFSGLVIEATAAVESAGKLPVLWGEIKAGF